MSVLKIKSALLEAVKAAAPSTPLEVDNTTLKPTAGKPWLQSRFSPNPPTPITCGDEGEDEMTGYLQVNVNAPGGVGENTHNALLIPLINTFKVGTTLSYEGQEVTVTSAGRAQGFPVDSWYRIPFTVAFRARYARATPV